MLIYMLFVSAGRASLSPTMDVFITLMQLGSSGYKRLTDQRKENFKVIQELLGKIAEKYGERVLNVKNNPISIGECYGLLRNCFLNEAIHS